MAENKTKPTRASVREFLDSIPDERRRKEAKAVAKIMRAVTGERPQMWGPTIVGFGALRYRYDSGREGDWFLAGFSPRKTALTLYIMSGFSGESALMKKLGKHTTGKACLYIKKLEDVDLDVLTALITRSADHVRRKSV